MKQNLTGKVAVITGAGGGIGRAAAKMLSEEGMKVVLLGGNNLEHLDETAELIRNLGECLVLPGNLTDLSTIPDNLRKIEEVFGGIDVLINNAGKALNSPFEQISIKQFDELMNINVKVPYFLTQAVLPYLRKSDCATVINISSVVGYAGYPDQSAYVASKHALLGFTKSVAREVYKENIRVHAICPGGVYTDMVRVARPDLTDEGMITPEEIAQIIHFLLEYRGNAVVDQIDVHRVNKEPFL